MKWLIVAFGLLLATSLQSLTVTASTAATMVTIDTAPSVVSHQGSSKTQSRLVISPVGRSLGYVESAQLEASELNRALQRSERLNAALDELSVSPVYMGQ